MLMKKFFSLWFFLMVLFGAVASAVWMITAAILFHPIAGVVVSVTLLSVALTIYSER